MPAMFTLQRQVRASARRRRAGRPGGASTGSGSAAARARRTRSSRSRRPRARRDQQAMVSGWMLPSWLCAVVGSAASGMPLTMPAKMISEMPLPMPRSVICSPSHMRRPVPVVSVMIVISRKPQPGLASRRRRSDRRRCRSCSCPRAHGDAERLQAPRARSRRSACTARSCAARLRPLCAAPRPA